MLIDPKLRQKVAEALGCKAKITDLGLICGCKDEEDIICHVQPKSTILIKFYEIDYHTALDALMEFCEQNDCVWKSGIWKYGGSFQNKDYWVMIVVKDKVYTAYSKTFSIAICESIVKAAEALKKKG